MKEILLSKLATKKDVHDLIGFDSYLIDDHCELQMDSEVIIRGFEAGYGAICELVNVVIYDCDGEYDDYLVDDFWDYEAHTCGGFFDRPKGYYVPLDKLYIPVGKIPGDILLDSQEKHTITTKLPNLTISGIRSLDTSRKSFYIGSLFT